jgi:sensor domain CHASE-containing protein
MVMSLFEMLVVSAFLLGIILLVLLFVMAAKPKKSGKIVRKKVSGDLKKIKEQVEGEVEW